MIFFKIVETDSHAFACILRITFSVGDNSCAVSITAILNKKNRSNTSETTCQNVLRKQRP